MDLHFMIGIGVFLAVLFMLLGAWQRRLDRAEKKETLDKLQDAVVRGSHKPLAQYPQIDPFLCIGCGSCIEACPEDEVIGLVNGIAHIINGSRCVGHAKCEIACPVAAIKVGLGNTSLRPDVPVLTNESETSMPGIFIAGELGGLALIRNAMEQGSKAIETIAQQLSASPPPSETGIHDVVIVGAGPAGLAASLKATELKLKYLTISQEDIGGAVRKYPRRKLTLVQSVEIPLHGRMKGREYEKEEIIVLWEQLIRDHQLRIQTGVSLAGIKRAGALFEVETNKGRIRSRKVVLAMGRRGTPRKLGVAGEESAKVFYHLIDAAAYSRQALLVVGGGDSAVEAATGLANQTGNTVTLSYRKNDFFRLKSRNEKRIREYMSQNKVRVLFSSQVESIEPQAVTLTQEAPGRKERLRLPNDFVFVFAGGDPPYPLLKQIGIRFGGETSQRTL